MSDFSVLPMVYVLPFNHVESMRKYRFNNTYIHFSIQFKWKDMFDILFSLLNK